jgi:hypothetical protein
MTITNFDIVHIKDPIKHLWHPWKPKNVVILIWLTLNKGFLTGSWFKRIRLALWKKGVFCNWACNLIFELQWPFVAHYIFTPMNVIAQVAWVVKNATHYILDHTLMQLPYNYNHNVMLTSLFIHSSKSNMCHCEDFWVNLFLDNWYPPSIMIVQFI